MFFDMAENISQKEGKVKPKVLIVEDGELWQEQWKGWFDGKITLLKALSIDEARRLFGQNSDLSVIVMDACVPGDWPNTQPIVTEFRKTFKGPMVATSGISDYRLTLIQAGCDYEASKLDVPQTVLRILDLQ